MKPRTARIVLIAAAIALVVTAAAFALWPRSEPRADLVQRPPAASSTIAPPTTTTVPTSEAPSTTTTLVPPPPGSLWIPSIGLIAPVVPVGLNPDGSMEVPPATDVGWYEPGVRPGAAQGSAVLAAHVDYAGQRGAFFDLRSVPDGAEIFVVGPDGSNQRFVVSERFQVDKEALPTEELFRSNGPATLSLITCGGAFDSGRRHYEDNIVVRAVPA